MKTIEIDDMSDDEVECTIALADTRGDWDFDTIITDEFDAQDTGVFEVASDVRVNDEPVHWTTKLLQELA